MKYLLLFLLYSFLPLFLRAQQTKIFTEDIRTFRLIVDGEDHRLPILQLGGRETLEVSFDDLTHEYRRYTYRVEHCSYDFHVSEQLFESEYITSPSNEEVVTTYEQSLNTAVLYTHYRFTIPNQTMRPLLSGNYRLTLMREDERGENKAVAQTYFAVIDPKVSIKASVSANTDIDYHAKHQQLSLDIDVSALPLILSPREEIKVYVLQNRRWDNAAICPAPTALSHQQLSWRNSSSLIFPAGNEFRKFETLSTRYATMRVEHLYSLGNVFHAEIATDEPKQHYLYDEDQNGRYVIRTNDRQNDRIEADYLWTHFSLKSPLLQNKRVFLYGWWTSNLLSPAYELKYNPDKQAYETAILLKQGYYSYQYIVTEAKGRGKGSTDETEGNFFQTDNEYTILVYFRSPTERYDRLVGMQQLRSQ